MKLISRLAVLAALPLFSGQCQGDSLAPSSRWTAYTAGRASTPPMGWSSWNAFATDIDEDKIIGSAQALVDSGLARKGDVPSFRPFTGRLHAMGLKAGTYSDLGRNTCSQAYSIHRSAFGW